jgi:Pro-kumamolisin, activation domain/Bacterial Ig-like domain (group 3)
VSPNPLHEHLCFQEARLPQSRGIWTAALLTLFLCGSLCFGQTQTQAVGQAASTSAQVVAARALVTQPIDDQVRVTLKGNVHPLAQARFDRGAVADSFSAERILLLLKRPPEREAALRQFMLDIYTRGSASYHQWLTPEEFGKQYGPADADIAAVSAWLQSHGFSVARVTKGKTALEFSGNAGQLREAFNTEIHAYLINGEEHHANNRDPQIPAALVPVVAGLTPLNDFHPKSQIRILGKISYDPSTHQLTPQWTEGPNDLAVAPGDFAVQYDLNPLYSAGTNGSGVTVGLIGASNVDPAVIAEYRSITNLSGGSFNVVVDGNDPGINDAFTESYLDIEVSAGVAPGAAIILYTAADTAAQSGLNLAAQRAVDDNLAAVLSTSYSTCEQQLGAAGNQFWAALWEQAAAQGQTSFVSSGDNGPAGCDDFNALQPAQYGLAVNGISSTPWNVSVGGTDFSYTSYNGTASAQLSELATYWDLTSVSFFPTTSLLKPIPEQAWNRPFGLNLYDGGVYDPTTPSIVAGSGGASNCISGVAAGNGTFVSCTGGYAKPPWQTGAGVPADSSRDLPDLSLFAASGENDSYYPILDEYAPGPPIEIFFYSAVGGTSASSPAMAGIMALVNQRYGRQGQANFVLYPLAVQHPSVFHDITIGSNVVPCLQGSLSCALSTLSDNTNGFYTTGRYYSAPGYDQATGLGSVDADLLAQSWNSLTFAPTSTALDLGQTSFAHGTPVTVSIAVSGTGGTPSGDVAVVTTASPDVNTGLGQLTLQSGAASGSFNNFPGGQYQVIARYAGDAIFAPSSSTPVMLNVTPEKSTLTLSANITSGGSYAYGTDIGIDAQPVGVNAPPGKVDGIATGTVTFTDAYNTGPIGSGPIGLNSQSIAEWVPTAGFAVGTHSVSASYSGDASFDASSTTTPLAFTVTKMTPTVQLSADPTAIALGSAITLTAYVQCSAYAAPPTGTVSFYLGSTLLGAVPFSTVPVLSAAPCVKSAILNPASLPLGTNSITATYNGDGNSDAATSAPISVIVGEPSKLAATANPTSINEFQSTTVTANVPGVSGLAAPTGAVTFSGGVGSGPCTSNLSNGVASCTFAGGRFPEGQNLIDVSYAGDSTYAPAEVMIPLTVTSVPFAISGTAVTLAAPGATAGNTSTIVITPGGGFTGAVALSCALTSSPSGAQDLPMCSVPSSVSVSGASAATAAMTISSTAVVSGALPHARPNNLRRLMANTGAALACVFLLGILAPRRGRRLCMCLLFFLVVLGGFAGCGGGGSGGGGSGTTQGAYVFTVTGTNQSYSARATISVTIQ